MRVPRGWLLLTALLMLPLWAAAATAVPIAFSDLGAESSILSPDGSLEYSGFAVFSDGIDTSSLAISVTAVGLTILGPFTLTDGAEGNFQLLYQVTVSEADTAIEAMSLSADSSLVEGGFPSFVKTEKFIYAGPPPAEYNGEGLLAQLSTHNFEGEIVDSDAASFDPQQTLTILDNIRLASGGPGGSATLHAVTNGMTASAVVPEPTSLLLLAPGLTGLVWVGRRRRRIRSRGAMMHRG